MTFRSCLPVLVALFAMLGGCTEQRDLDVVSNPLVKLTCDWSRARLNPDIWTVMFYPDNSASARQFVMDRPVDTLQLAAGSYRTLIINGTLGSGIDYVRFRGTDNYDTFEALASTAEVKANGEIVVNEPDTLAGTAFPRSITGERAFVTKYINGRLQPGDTRHYVSDSIEYVPCRLVYRIRVIVDITNMNYLKPARAVTGDVHGLAGGVMVASRMPTHAPVVYLLSFPNTNASSATEGTIETAFASFGPPLDLSEPRDYYVDLAFVLTNNRTYRFDANVSDQVAVIAAQIKDRIDRGVCDAGLNLELRLSVTLPVPDPNPNPDPNPDPNGGGGGKDDDINVDPWEDDKKQDIFL